MHGFEVEIQTSAEAISPEDLASRAESMGAVASVSFVRSAGITTADIKISDRVTGKTSIRTIATPVGSAGASLLALRAVELLRTSLREYWGKGSIPNDIVGAAPERASPTVTQWAAPPVPAQVTAKPKRSVTVAAAPALHRYSVRADFVAAAMFGGPHAAYGLGGADG